MNKVFVDEYRDFIKQSTPDLWARIEAGIEDLVAGDTASSDMVSSGIASSDTAPSDIAVGDTVSSDMALSGADSEAIDKFGEAMKKPGEAMEKPNEVMDKPGEAIDYPSETIDKPSRKVEAARTERSGAHIVEGKDFAVEAPGTVKLEKLSYQSRPSARHRYGGLIAACLAAAIIIPGVYFGRGLIFGGGMSSGEMSSGNLVSYEAQELAMDAALSGVDEEMTGSGGNASGINENGRGQDLAAGGADMIGQGAGDQSAMHPEAAFREVVGEDGMTAAEAEVEFCFADIGEMRQYYFAASTDEKTIDIAGATIMVSDIIADATTIVNDISIAGDRDVYLARLIADESGILRSDIDFYFLKADNLDIEIAIGATYIVNMTYLEANAPYYFTVNGISE